MGWLRWGAFHVRRGGVKHSDQKATSSAIASGNNLATCWGHYTIDIALHFTFYRHLPSEPLSKVRSELL